MYFSSWEPPKWPMYCAGVLLLLGLWKFIEIINWLIIHVHMSIK